MSVRDQVSLYTSWLLDVKSSEEQLVKTLPAVADVAVSPRLRQVFRNHELQTGRHFQIVTQLLVEANIDPNGPPCNVMKGLIAESKEMIDELEPGQLLDAALIGIAQKVEHFEIGAYGTLLRFATLLGRATDAEQFSGILEEERATAALLDRISEDTVDRKSVAQAGS